MAEVYKRACCGTHQQPVTEPWKSETYQQCGKTIWPSSPIVVCVAIFEALKMSQVCFVGSFAASVCLELIGERLPQFHFSHQRVQKPQKVHTQQSYLLWMDRLAWFEYSLTWSFEHSPTWSFDYSPTQSSSHLSTPSSHLGLPGSKHFPPQAPKSQVSRYHLPTTSESQIPDLIFRVVGIFSSMWTPHRRGGGLKLYTCNPDMFLLFSRPWFAMKS